jgi:hypothetical protein
MEDVLKGPEWIDAVRGADERYRLHRSSRSNDKSSAESSKVIKIIGFSVLSDV